MKVPGPTQEVCNTLLKFFQNGQFTEAENFATTLSQNIQKINLSGKY